MTAVVVLLLVPAAPLPLPKPADVTVIRGTTFTTGYRNCEVLVTFHRDGRYEWVYPDGGKVVGTWDWTSGGPLTVIEWLSAEREARYQLRLTPTFGGYDCTWDCVWGASLPMITTRLVPVREKK